MWNEIKKFKLYENEMWIENQNKNHYKLDKTKCELKNKKYKLCENKKWNRIKKFKLCENKKVKSN